MNKKLLKKIILIIIVILIILLIFFIVKTVTNKNNNISNETNTSEVEDFNEHIIEIIYNKLDDDTKSRIVDYKDASINKMHDDQNNIDYYLIIFNTNDSKHINVNINSENYNIISINEAD